MSMILHLFKTDVRHSRVLLSVWLLLVLLQCVLIGSSVHPGDRLLQGIYYSISGLVPLFQALVLVVIIPQLVLEAPLVGTTAFWFTRPIERSALLQAKALFAAMLIALPLLAEVGVLAASGVTLHDIGLAVPEIILAQLSLIVVLAGVAIFTEGFGRFAIAGAIVLVAMILATMGIYWVRLLLHPATVLNMGQELSLVKARGVTESLLVVIGGGAVIAHQYLTRRTARSLAGACAVAVGAIAILGFWPWNYFAPPPPPEAGSQFDVAAVKVSLGRTMTRDVTTIRGVGAPQKNLDATIDTTGLPAGYVASLRQARARLSLPDGRLVPTQEPGPTYFGSRPNSDVLEHALGGTPVVNSDSPYRSMTGLLTVDADVYGRHADEPLNLTADLDFLASRYVIVTEMPLVRGARYDHGSEHAIITDVLREGDGVEVVVEQRNVQLLFSASDNAAGNAAANYLRDQSDTVYLLRNKKRNEAILTKQNPGFALSDMFSMGAKRLVHRTLRLPFGPEQFNLTPELNEAWLAGAELVRLQLVPMAAFSKQLVVEKLKLSSQNVALRRAPASPPVDPASFARLVLPENATRAQVKDYVNSILVASQRRNSFRPDDPQVGLLLKIGPKNLDVLLEAADRVTTSPKIYLEFAIERLAGPENKALVLQTLATRPNLAEQVVRYDWKAEAHDTLVAGLRDEQQRSLPRAWIQAVASFKEPTTYPDLKAYLLRCTNRQQTFNAIWKLPGIDLEATVEALWQKARLGSPYESSDVSTIAVTFGHLDALEALVNELRQGGSEAGLKRAATLVKRHTPATGDNAALVAWFDANRDRLTFDPAKKQFVPRPPAPTPAGLR